MIYVQLMWEFFKIGLFAVGGGLSTLPFLINLTYKYDWFDKEMLTNMLAISQATPGPMGVNIATYTGYQTQGILGGIAATLSLIAPSIIIIIIIARFLDKFKDNKYVDSVFNGLRPAVVGLIGVAGFEVVKIALFNFDLFRETGRIIDLFYIKGIILFIISFYAVSKFKKHPIIYIISGAIIGILFKF